MSVRKLKRFGHIDGFDSPLFTCINYNDTCISSEKPYIQIAAFDPGVVNTGCRIERRFLDENGTLTIKTIKQELFKSAAKGSEFHYYVTMKNHLYSIAEDLYECDYILVESQMRNNPEATRMSQHIISTLLGIIEGSTAIIIEILPTVKSKSFGIKGLKGKDLKKKATEIATEILRTRQDHVAYDIITSSKKKDDIADVVLYCDAWYRFLQTDKFAP